MQQVREFLFIAAFGIGFRRPYDFHPGFFEDANDVIRRGLTLRSKLGDQLSANLLDFSGGEARFAEFLRCFEDECLFGGRPTFFVRRMVAFHEGPRCEGLFAAVSVAGFSPERSRRYFATLRLCSASVLLKKCPPLSLATKNK